MSGQTLNTTLPVDMSTRRRWTEEEKRAILAEVRDGISVSEVARRKGVARDLLFRWRREERRKSGPGRDVAGFVPLSLPALHSPPGDDVEVVLASGVRLAVSGRTNLALLRRVIAALS